MGDPAADGASLLDAIDDLRDDYREDVGHLRDDFREDLGALETRVMAAIASVARSVDDGNRLHAAVHAKDAESLADKLRTYDAWIEASKIAQARRDGALGIARYLADVVGRNWRGILAVAGGAALLFGQVHVTVVTP